jgi:aryl-alcohol dehydrogenase-like predicted oxidoreductase
VTTDNVVAGVERSLVRMKTDYLDVARAVTAEPLRRG